MSDMAGALFDLMYDTCGARFDELNKPATEEQDRLADQLRALVSDDAWQVYLQIDELHGRMLSNLLSFAVQCVPKVRREIRQAVTE